MSDITKIAVEDLIEKPLKDLLALQTKIVKAIDLRRDTEKLDLANKIQQMAAESGFTLEELAKLNVKKPKKPRQDSDKPKKQYANPNNSSEIYKGKGPKPLWFKEYVDSGKNKDDLLIK